jgi:signal transduction histidine kinase
MPCQPTPCNNQIALKAALTLLLIVFALYHSAIAQPIALYEGIKRQPLGHHVQFLFDTTAAPIEAIAQRSNFASRDQQTPNFGFSNANLWARTSFIDRSLTPRRWVVEIGIPGIHEVTFYVRRVDGGFDSTHAGFLTPRATRPTSSLCPSFLLPPPTDSVHSVWMRIRSKTPLLLPLNLFEEHQFYRHDRSMQDFLGLYFGALIIMALYHFYLFLSLKERSYLYFSLFMALFGLGQLSAVYGFLVDYLGPNFVRSFLPFTHLFNFTALFFGMLFSRTMIESPRLTPHLDKFIVGLTALTAAAMPLSLLLDFMHNEQLLVYLGPLCAITLLISALCSMHQGSKPASTYLHAVLVTLIGLIAYNLMYGFNLLPFSLLLYFAPNICFLATIVLFSFGLATHINEIKLGREQAAEMALHHLRRALQIQEEKTVLEHQLAQAQKMEALGRLVGGISHDLKNLLTPLYGYAELIQQHARSESSRLLNYVERMKSAIKQIRDLSNNLLRFSRKEDPQSVLTNLEEAIAHVIELLRHSNCKGASIKTRFAVHQPIISGDISLIEQALLNLGLNACDALQNNSGNITFQTDEARLSEDGLICKQFNITPGLYYTLEVSDNGCGMSPEVMAHLFEPFFTTKPRGQGTGLGLASVYGCVTSHRGAITVQSSPGQGSCFTLYFPHPTTLPDRASRMNSSSV